MERRKKKVNGLNNRIMVVVVGAHGRSIPAE